MFIEGFVEALGMLDGELSNLICLGSKKRDLTVCLPEFQQCDLFKQLIIEVNIGSVEVAAVGTSLHFLVERNLSFEWVQADILFKLL